MPDPRADHSSALRARHVSPLLFAFAFRAFPDGFEPFFAACRPVGSALDQLGANQFEFSRLSTVALAPAELHDSRVAPAALIETRPKLFEQLLDRLLGHEECRRLTPGVQ